ncbi:MAG: ribosome silencing factor [Flavobacteriales bacterium]|nr:ribosome silencing factor [Flavobacteriales bacterium]
MTKRTQKAATKKLVNAIIEGIREVKGHEIVSLNLEKIGSAPADYFVICTGTSSTQVEAIAHSVEKETEKVLGEKPRYVEGRRNSKWILMDYFNVIVHIFDESSRKYYSLHQLWADAETEMIPELA